MRRALLLYAVVATVNAAAMFDPAGRTDAVTNAAPVHPLDRRHLHHLGRWRNNFTDFKYLTEKRRLYRTDGTSVGGTPPGFSVKRQSIVSPKPGNLQTGYHQSTTKDLTAGTNRSNNGVLKDGRWVWSDSGTTEKVTFDNRVALKGDDCPEGRIRITNSLCVRSE